MKLLIAFALFAVALADEVKVVDLPKIPEISPIAIPDIRQLIIPQHVIDAIKMRVPIMREEPANDVSEDLKVRIAEAPLDAPVQADAPQEFDDGLEVHYVYHASDAEEIAIPEAVVLGEAPQPAYEAEELSAPELRAPEPVMIAEPYVPTNEAIDAPKVSDYSVKFVDAPLEVAAPMAEEIPAPDAVRIAEAPLPAMETPESAPEPSLEAVKIAVPRFPVKQFADPTWR